MTRKQSKIVAGVALGLGAVMVVGSIGLVSKGFKNMDARDWVGGYEHVLEVSEDAQYLCTNATCSGDCEFTQDGRAVISFKSEEENIAAHGSAKLFDQDGKEFKRANVTLSFKITIDEDTMAGITFGFDVSSGPAYYGVAFMLDYDKDSELLRVIAHPDYNTWIGSEQHTAPDTANVYSNSYTLSYYGLSSLKDIKMSVKKTVTATGSKYEVTVGNKVIEFLSHCDDDGNYILKDATDADGTVSKSAYPVYLTAYGTEATFKEVKWSE
ncbi:MAG: hypothetical protein J6C23_09305 [Clostridia bacterium]|nr:hypothetical protein [Clostridia bacterium]